MGTSQGKKKTCESNVTESKEKVGCQGQGFVHPSGFLREISLLLPSQFRTWSHLIQFTWAENLSAEPPCVPHVVKAEKEDPCQGHSSLVGAHSLLEVPSHGRHSLGQKVLITRALPPGVITSSHSGCGMKISVL